MLSMFVRPAEDSAVVPCVVLGVDAVILASCRLGVTCVDSSVDCVVGWAGGMMVAPGVDYRVSHPLKEATFPAFDVAVLDVFSLAPYYAGAHVHCLDVSVVHSCRFEGMSEWSEGSE